MKRLCLRALQISEQDACVRYLQETLPLLGTGLPGIRNEGLLSTHELQRGARNRNDWQKAQELSLPLLANNITGSQLLESLDYNIDDRSSKASILSTRKEKIAVALLLDDAESRENKTDRFHDYTPLEYAFAEAKDESLPWIFVIQWGKIRVYSTDSDFGISKNPANTSFIEVCLSTLDSKNAGFIWLLFSSQALTTNGYIYEIKEQSERYAAKLTENLRTRVYDNVMPSLVKGVMEARNIPDPDRTELDLVYEISINILYRLLLVAYAEDRNYLPYASNNEYQKRSLKQKAIYLSEPRKRESDSCHHWDDVQTIWRAIHKGNSEFGLPEYGGSILSDDENESEIGHYISQLKIKNKFLVPALKKLLLTQVDGRAQAVDFRSLSIRELGSIYEVMLEKEATVAHEDILEDEEIIVKKGEVYIHDKSGARQMSGSFYTPDNLVNHLLDRSLEPAIEDHLNKLEGCPDDDLPNRLFSFSVADIAMGSGHFLIAAIDRIERRFNEWLRDKEYQSIDNLVSRLEKTAKENIEKCSTPMEVDTKNILRRVIAYSCIYGVDINRPAVILARLSIWLHTFVPGLPLFLLDRNLLHGNSLIGIANANDIERFLDKDSLDFFSGNFASYYSRIAGDLLGEIAKIHFTSISDIQNTKDLLEQIRIKNRDIEKWMDMLLAQRLNDDPRSAISKVNFETWEPGQRTDTTDRAYSEANSMLQGLDVVHFPLRFPEVFARKTECFDVVLGNPPWQKIKTREDSWLARYFPGLKGKNNLKEKMEKIFSQNPNLRHKYEQDKMRVDYMRAMVLNGNYPGIGAGDPDYFMAFAWRFMSILKSSGGRMGVVMPRTICNSAGTSEFRKTLFESGWHVTLATLENRSQWAFKEIHGSYTIVLLDIYKSAQVSQHIDYLGHHVSLQEFTNKSNPRIQIHHKDLYKWGPRTAIPIIPHKNVYSLISAFYRHPSLSDKGFWYAQPYYELHVTQDRKKFHNTSKGEKDWLVYRGRNIDIWDCDANRKNRLWANSDGLLQYLYEKRQNPSSNSVWSRFPSNHLEDRGTLPSFKPRIAFRGVTGHTNRRTMLACLVPPHTFLASTGALVFPAGDEKDEAYLLGILSSMPLDWLVRRFVEVNVSFDIIRYLPIPRLCRTSPVWHRIVQISGKLAAKDQRFSEWASNVGVRHGPHSDDKKFALIAELDALAAIAYELSEKQLIYIYDTFHSKSQSYYTDHRRKALANYQRLVRSSQ